MLLWGGGGHMAFLLLWPLLWGKALLNYLASLRIKPTSSCLLSLKWSFENELVVAEMVLAQDRKWFCDFNKTSSKTIDTYKTLLTLMLHKTYVKIYLRLTFPVPQMKWWLSCKRPLTRSVESSSTWNKSYELIKNYKKFYYPSRNRKEWSEWRKKLPTHAWGSVVHRQCE